MRHSRHMLAQCIIAAYLELTIGCVSDTSGPVDGPDGARGTTASASSSFWAPFQAEHFDWVEGKSTLKELARDADLVALARVEGVTLGTMIQGDAAEDVYLEADLQLALTDVIRGLEPAQNVVLTLVLTSPSRAEGEAAVARINASGLDAPALFLLRRRESGKYRVVNGHGIWVANGESLATPLVSTGEPGLELYEAEVSPYPSLSELANSLRY